jgi:hypothetical protein
VAVIEGRAARRSPVADAATWKKDQAPPAGGRRGDESMSIRPMFVTVVTVVTLSAGGNPVTSTQHPRALRRSWDFSRTHKETNRLLFIALHSDDPDFFEHIWETRGAPQKCPGCGLYFWPEGREKHCNAACRQKAYRKRHPELREQERRRMRQRRKGIKVRDNPFYG